MKDYTLINQNNLKAYLHTFWDYKKLKILFFSIYQPDYTRTETIEQLFSSLWISYIKNSIYKKNYFVRVCYNILRLIKNIRECDVVYVHFRWHEILPIVSLISYLFGKKVIFDMFISLWDTICFDRRILRPRSLPGRFIKIYDKFLIRIADFVLLDTYTHLQYVIHELWLPENKWGFLYVWANTENFHPLHIEKSSKFRIFWYGNVLPLQGVEIILRVAKLLENNNNIEFFLVWPVRKRYGDLIKELSLSNVRFKDRVPYKDLYREICKSHLCLWWHFGIVPKSGRVIAGKTFQFLSCEIPTIVWDCKANREILEHWDKLIRFVKMWDENALADLINEHYVKS